MAEKPAFTIKEPAATAIKTEIIFILSLKIPEIASFLDNVSYTPPSDFPIDDIYSLTKSP